MHTRRYSAFISYRHADNTQEGRRWAEWLHRALERYVVPPDLIGTPNLRDEPIRDSLYPIFRDEDELPANADLATGIRAALEVSDHLIVLCSPRSAVSPWVRKEVREFKELGRSDRILAIIIAGEPNADDPAKAREGILRDEECFCEELRFGAVREGGGIDWTARTEPTAADLRSPGTRAEGFVTAEAYREHLTLNSSLTPDKIATRTETYRQRLDQALFKVIAGLLGVPLGQLVDRDAVHRADLAKKELARAEAEAARLRILNRRIAAAGFVALVLALFAGWLGMVAARAKDRALVQQRRAEEALTRGEKVIDYLVGDLHDHLRSVGRIDYLQKAEEKVREYYKEAGTEKFAVNAARAFNQLGDLAMTRRDFDTAGLMYEHAAQLLRETSNEQTGFRLLYEQTVNARNLAWVAIKQKAWDTARLQIDLAFARQKQMETHAHGPKDRLLADKLHATIHDLNGDLHRWQENYDAAFQSYQLAVKMENALLPKIEAQLMDADPDAMRVLRERSVALGKIGDIHAKAPLHLEDAVRAYRSSLADRERLVSLDPRNLEFRADLSVALNKLCKMEILSQAWSEARTHIDRAIELARRLSEFEPSSATWASNTIQHIEMRGDLCMAESRPVSAIQDYTEALRLEFAAFGSPPTNGLYRRAWLHNKLGEALFASHDANKASIEFNNGINLLAQAKEPPLSESGQFQDLRALLQGNLKKVTAGK